MRVRLELFIIIIIDIICLRAVRITAHGITRRVFVRLSIRITLPRRDVVFRSRGPDARVSYTHFWTVSPAVHGPPSLIRLLYIYTRYDALRRAYTRCIIYTYYDMYTYCTLCTTDHIALLFVIATTERGTVA